MKKILSMFLITSSLVFADNNSIGLDTIVGATLGVAIGNQIGKGNGRDVAKVAGGLLGASIANNSRTPSYSTPNYSNSYRDNNYRDSYYDNNYERSTTYVRTDRYYDDDYYYRRQPAQVTVIYQNYDRFPPPPRYYYDRHPHHRDMYRYGR